MLAEDELRGVPLLVFANKQDLPDAYKPDYISERLGLAGAEKDRQWSVQGSCATSGDGLEEGLTWYVPHRRSYVTRKILNSCTSSRLVNAIKKQ